MAEHQTAALVRTRCSGDTFSDTYTVSLHKRARNVVGNFGKQIITIPILIWACSNERHNTQCSMQHSSTARGKAHRSVGIWTNVNLLMAIIILETRLSKDAAFFETTWERWTTYHFDEEESLMSTDTNTELSFIRRGEPIEIAKSGTKTRETF